VNAADKETGVKPTIVLVHGAFADASSWNGVIERLQQQGYTVIATANPLRGLAADSAYTASLLNQIDGPVLLVGHSYTGAVITNAATSTPNVAGLVYIAAFATEEGENLNDVESGSKDSILGAALVQYKYPAGPDEETAVELAVNPALFREAFARDHDLPAAGGHRRHRDRGPARRRRTPVDDDEHRTHDEHEAADMTMSTPFGALKQVDAGPLSVGYADVGPAGGPAVMLLHGWPYDIHSFADVTPMLASAGYRVIVPFVRGYGTTRFLSDDALRNGQQAALAADVIALMDALGIDAAILAGFDWGARSADVVAALWPDRCRALGSVSGYLIGSQAASQAPLPPQAELAWWYQFYFATDRGQAGYEKYRREFSKLIWRLASPKWVFDDATFARSAAAFDNPDHVAIVIHNYRWRLGVAAGESRYDDLERRLAGFPAITVPAITVEGDANGAPHPDASAYASKFTGKYEHRVVEGGIGHNLPQEAPQAFAEAIIDAGRH
jgi:pimeloyl-ACP methyl ester carboxylesterase